MNVLKICVRIECETCDDALVLCRNDVLDATRDEGWVHHCRGSGGLICQKRTGK